MHIYKSILLFILYSEVLTNVANKMSEESVSSINCFERRKEAINVDRRTDGCSPNRQSLVVLVDMLARLETLLQQKYPLSYLLTLTIYY